MVYQTDYSVVNELAPPMLNRCNQKLNFGFSKKSIACAWSMTKQKLTIEHIDLVGFDVKCVKKKSKLIFCGTKPWTQLILASQRCSLLTVKIQKSVSCTKKHLIRIKWICVGLSLLLHILSHPAKQWQTQLHIDLSLNRNKKQSMPKVIILSTNK